MHILFHCESSVKIGMGHVMRCLTVANKLSEKGWLCDFFCTKQTLETVPFLKEKNFRIFHEKEKLGAGYDVIIVDNYAAGKLEETFFRSLSERIVVIDDLANRDHDCDVLLDQTLGRCSEDYKNLVPEDALILTGERYALLRPEFRSLRKSAKEKRHIMKGQINNVLISMGGTDEHNVTMKALEVMARIHVSLKIDVVLGQAAPFKSQVENFCKKMSKEGISATLHVNVTDMAEMMVTADLAIGASGTTSWERCCLGLPTLMLQTADNQQKIAVGLHVSGAAMFLGVSDKVTSDDILRLTTQCLYNPHDIDSMSRIAFSICDGNGVERFIPSLVADKETNTRLRLMERSDMTMLFKWQQIPQTRQYARNPEAPTWEQHEAWFTKTMDTKNRHLYMIEHDNMPAGMVRLDPKPNDAAGGQQSYEVSILLDPDHYGKGVAAAALTLIRKIEPDMQIWAEVLPENKASRKLFERLKYKAKTATWFVQDGHDNI